MADSPTVGSGGFVVRPPRAAEQALLRDFFPRDPLGKQSLLFLGAFSQSDNAPLGAVMIRPATQDGLSVGHFLIHVRPEFRRKKIGSILLSHLYALALKNKADKMIVPELIHYNLADNAFYRANGLTPERTFFTYVVPVQTVLEMCASLVERSRRYQHALSEARIERFANLDRVAVAQFFASYYGGFVDQRLAQFERGIYDLFYSSAIILDDKIIAGFLCRTIPGEKAGMLDLILIHPAHRTGIATAMLCHHMAVRVKEGGVITHCVFEADPQHDQFAIGFARRCGAKPGSQRYRYSISKSEMQLRAVTVTR